MNKWNLNLKTQYYFINISKLKYLAINLTKYTQDSYEENYKTLLKEIKEKINKWRDNLCSCIGRLNIVKISVFPKLIYRFKALPIQIPTCYCVDIDYPILKFLWKGKRHRIVNTILKEKNKVEELRLFGFKTYDTATAIRRLWYWRKNRQMISVMEQRV